LLYTIFFLSSFFLFLSTDTPATEFYSLSLHDALPIFIFIPGTGSAGLKTKPAGSVFGSEYGIVGIVLVQYTSPYTSREQTTEGRSEEHTSELQSRSDLVCRLLLEKKKQ